MGLFRYRSFHHDQLSEYNRQHGNLPKHSIKNDNVDFEQVIKETFPPDNPNIYTSWNIDLLYCNLVGSYPMLSDDTNQDLVQRHGKQLLQLKDIKKFHMDRCTKLEEICSNWILKPKLYIPDDLLIQMKHRSRLIHISVVPVLFSRAARFFFHNDSTLRVNNTLNLNDYQIAQNQLARFDTSRLNTIEQQYVQTTDSLVEQLSTYLQTQYKFHIINTKPIQRKTLRSANVQSPKELNFHRYDSNRRVTILGELSTLNNSEVVLRFLQYDIIKIPMNNQSSSTAMIHHRQISHESTSFINQLELDAWGYDHHLETIVRYQTGTDETHIFPQDFSVILFLQEFIEYYPNAPIGSKTAIFKTIIHHQLDQTTKRSADSYLFKYVLDHADSYGIKIKRRNADEYLFDSESNDIYWIAARTTPPNSSELTVVMYIIYTNLSSKTGVISVPSKTANSSANAITRIPPNSLKSNCNYNPPRDRASTMLLPPPKINLVTVIRPNSNNCEQPLGNNIPTDKNVEFFKLKLTSILTRASLSHRRESLWQKLIGSRPEHVGGGGRQEATSIQVNEFESLLDSCTSEEITDLKNVVHLLQRVFTNKDQSERLQRFLRSRYGSQLHALNSATTNYLVIYQCKAPHQCEAFIVLIYRADQNTLKSCLVKHRNDNDWTQFVQTFTQRISYFLWECLT